MWVMFAFFIVVTVIFILIALFFPEWVGITGNRAHEIQAHQQEEKPKLSEEESLEKNNPS